MLLVVMAVLCLALTKKWIDAYKNAENSDKKSKAKQLVEKRRCRGLVFRWTMCGDRCGLRDTFWKILKQANITKNRNCANTT
jgi:hypothetical protein